VSLTTPTTKQISDNIVAQIEAAISQSVPLLPKAFVRVLAKALAGVVTILYKYAGFIFLQMFVRYASFSETTINGKTLTPLIEWGRLIGVGDPAAATRAELLIDITVTNQTGSLPSGSQLLNTSNGVTYITIGAVSLDAAVVQATIRAVSDQSGDGSGVIGNLDAGSVVAFASPLPNVQRDAVVVSQSVTGADAESEAAYRQRVIDRFQKRPQGGAYADYELWGEEPSGIVNVYPYTGSTPGYVDVYVEATPESSGSPDGIPTTAQLQEVLDAIELDQAGLATRRPANAYVNVLSITRSAFDIEVVELVVDSPVAVKADIEAAIDEYMAAAEPFIPGVSVLPRKDTISRTAIGGVVSDIVNAAGGVFGSITLKDPDGLGVDVYALQQGEKAKAGTVTYP